MTEAAFGCTMLDIDWIGRGYESRKLKFINYEMGYFYNGHRSLNDCWATLNIITRDGNIFQELRGNVKKNSFLVCALGAPYEIRGELKARGYKWSSGEDTNLPKCWWTEIYEENLDAELAFLDSDIFKREGVSKRLPQKKINAYLRYSARAENVT